MVGTLYKPGQGFWTRTMTAAGAALLALMGAAWVVHNVNFGSAGTQIYVKAVAGLIFFIILGLLGYYYIGTKPGSVEYMIATESEMKKVNWSSRREIAGSTWVVIGMTVALGFLTAILDLAFATFFKWVGVLQS
ncbi:MAG TPA: preprotein translocase subunit SecE [Phycisphaerales bacterium]|nr:preprotein translocase subunit SecE [Phycisphaerales bacterium]